MLSVGTLPNQVQSPIHLVAVHVRHGKPWVLGVSNLEGKLLETIVLDEQRIAELINESMPTFSADKQTARERAHRLANAIMVVCKRYNAVCSVENVSYRRAPGPRKRNQRSDNSRTVFAYLTYKLPLENLLKPSDLWGVAPNRDCGRCGHRHDKRQVQADHFSCNHCGIVAPAMVNTLQGIIRRSLWILSKSPQTKTRPSANQDRPKRRKKDKPEPTVV